MQLEYRLVHLAARVGTVRRTTCCEEGVRSCSSLNKRSSYILIPKSCISRILAILVLLLRNALVSSKPWIAREISDIDMTVDPELYSTTVLVVPGTTAFSNKFSAMIQIRKVVAW